MIKTLFFPFSHISKDQLKVVTAFFSRVEFLPMVTDFMSDTILAPLAAQDILVPIFPLAKDLGLVEKQVHSYLDWAQLHRGNEKNLKLLLKEQPYFMEDTGLSSIQSQIRKGTQKKETSPDRKTIGRKTIDQKMIVGKKAVQDPLLLLKFAQLLDAENEGIDDQLNSLEQSRSSLFSQLLGETAENNSEKDDSDPLYSASPDPGGIMTEERVVSWFRYAGEKELFDVPGEMPLLITTSPAVLDYMVSKSEGVINALDIDSIKVHENGCVNKGKWLQDLFQFLKETIVEKGSAGNRQPEADDTCFLSGQIKLCLFPGDGIKAFLNIPDQSIAVCLVQLKS